jgi:hypothetical protein
MIILSHNVVFFSFYKRSINDYDNNYQQPLN